MANVDSKILEAVKALREEAFGLAMWLTDHPEISGEEKESCAYICRFLAEHGYEIESPYGGIDHSFRARRKKEARPGAPKVAILCEYDALPEIGHACGHSLSCGISVLTALALEQAYPDLPMEIDLIGTPGEEALGGKVIMARNHAFDGYDLAIMGHLDNKSCPQAQLLACSDMHITFHGKAAHASGAPWDGVNAYNAAQLFAHASDMLRQHLTPDCQIHGIITYGGAAPNIVPEKTVLDYYIRSATLKGLETMRKKLTDCVRGAAIATGCTWEIEQLAETYCDICYPRTAVDEMLDLFHKFDMPYYLCEKGDGSSDMGNVDVVIPTIAWYVGATDEYILFHSAEIVPQLRGARGRKTLTDGANVQACFLAELAFHPEKLAKIQAEHKAYRDAQRE